MLAFDTEIQHIGEQCGICWTRSGSAQYSMVVPCHHLFCDGCMRRVTRRGDHPRCPTCRGGIERVESLGVPTAAVADDEQTVDVHDSDSDTASQDLVVTPPATAQRDAPPPIRPRAHRSPFDMASTIAAAAARSAADAETARSAVATMSTAAAAALPENTHANNDAVDNTDPGVEHTREMLSELPVSVEMSASIRRVVRLVDDVQRKKRRRMHLREQFVASVFEERASRMRLQNFLVSSELLPQSDSDDNNEGDRAESSVIDISI